MSTEVNELKGVAEAKVDMSSPDSLANSILDQYATPPVAQQTTPLVEENAQQAEPKAQEATPKEEVKAPEAGGEAAAQVVSDDPLKSLLLGGEVAPAEVPKEVSEYLTKTGIDAKDVLGLPAIKEQLTTAEKQRDEYKAEVDRIAGLPQDVKNLIFGVLNGDKDAVKNFRQAPSIEDWSKPFEQQDPETMLAHYAKGKVTAEDIAAWRDPEGDPALKRVVDGHLGYAKVMFGSDQKRELGYIQGGIEKSQAHAKLLETSRTEAIQDLINIGGPSAAAYKDILSREMTPENILAQFFNPDGSYKRDAALTYMRARRDLFDQVTAAAKKVEVKAIKEEAAIEQVIKTQERPAPKQPAPQAVPKAPVDHARDIAMRIMDGIGV